MTPDIDAVIELREWLADDVIGLTLCRPDGGDMPEWAPGAHVDLLLDNGLVRQYSLCGDPAERGELRIAVLLEPDGRGGSAFVHDELIAGSKIRIRGPRNNFPLVPAQRYLFVAGGIGITPILPMVESMRPEHDWRLVYGGRTLTSMAFADRLARHPQVELHPQDWHGLLDLESLLDEPDDDTVIYCCGPESLLEAIAKASAHWPESALHVERFKPLPDVGESTPFEVDLARSGRTVHVPADRSILAALEEAGLSLLSSCREGTCGTCETDVLDGVPDHRDSLLTDAERAACDSMMICVSRSRSSRLTLDL